MIYVVELGEYEETYVAAVFEGELTNDDCKDGHAVFVKDGEIGWLKWLREHPRIEEMEFEKL